ncbi:MAG: FMN-binding protein [Clostridiales bacterium]|nr:FMN-binding protein [Clostridiales bacterium]
MRYKNFTLRLCNLLLILALLAVYQTVIYVRAQEEEIADLQTQVNQLQGENDAWQAAYDAYIGDTSDTDTEDTTIVSYADGTYSGSAEGFGGTIEVSVEISDGVITSVEIISAAGEDEAYLSLAEGLIDDIIEQQTADVDSVSGATYSSGGIKGAVEAALSEAVE